MEQQMRLTRTHDTNQRCICEFYSPSYSLFVLAAFLLPVFFTAAKKKNQIRINIHPLYKLRSRKSPIRYIIFVLNLQSSSELSGDGAAWPFGLGPRDRPFRSVSVGFLSTTIVPVCAMFADVYPFGVLDDAPFVADWLAIVPQSGRQFQTSLSAMPHNFLIFFSWLDLVYKTQMSKSTSDRRKKKQNKTKQGNNNENKEQQRKKLLMWHTQTNAHGTTGKLPVVFAIAPNEKCVSNAYSSKWVSRLSVPTVSVQTTVTACF